MSLRPSEREKSAAITRYCIVAAKVLTRHTQPEQLTRLGGLNRVCFQLQTHRHQFVVRREVKEFSPVRCPLWKPASPCRNPLFRTGLRKRIDIDFGSSGFVRLVCNPPRARPWRESTVQLLEPC